MPEQKSESYVEKPPSKIGSRLLIPVLSGLAIFIILSFYGDVQKVSRILIEFKWSYIPLILVLPLLNYLLRFCKWEYYLRCVGIKLPFKTSLEVFLSGLAMSVTPGKLGELLKSYLLKRLNDVEVCRSVPVILAERITDALGMLVLVAISFSAFKYVNEVFIVAVAFLLILVVGIIQSRGISSRLLDFLGKVPLISRVSRDLRTSYEAAYTLFKLKNLLVAIFISTISWGFECLAMYLVLQGSGMDISVLLSTFVFSFSSLAGAISMLPGGLVITEGSLVGLLMLAEMPREIAASATVIVRFCTLWLAVVIGFITLLIIQGKANRGPYSNVNQQLRHT
ncbi:YbhN family protein [Chloroflexota bacterium]